MWFKWVLTWYSDKKFIFEKINLLDPEIWKLEIFVDTASNCLSRYQRFHYKCSFGCKISLVLTWNTIKSHNCFQTTQGWRRSKGGCKIITPFELQLTRTTCTLWQSRLCTHPRGHSKTFCHLIHHCNRKQHVDSKYMESLATQNLAQSVRVVIKSLLYTDWCRTTGSLTLSAHKFRNTSQIQLFFFSISYL